MVKPKILPKPNHCSYQSKSVQSVFYYSIFFVYFVYFVVRKIRSFDNSRDLECESSACACVALVKRSANRVTHTFADGVLARFAGRFACQYAQAELSHSSDHGNYQRAKNNQ